MPGQDQKGDSELILSSASGDRAAFDELVARHQAAVYRFAYALTRDAARAEDAMQETFLAAWRTHSGFRGDSTPRSWLLAITRNAVIRQQRRRAGEPEDFTPLEELGAMAGWGAGDDPEKMAMRRQDRRLLMGALQSLAESDREILLLRELEEFTGDETAAILQIPLSAMKTRLHRARLRLAAALRSDLHEG